ncbi:hypothetical protein CRE_23533 [Caenorhabditis remanei]|uniref:SCP domain-containing protein n=1 Tax=Caenorhabditis remanei TaxID=31234 RepID=E3MH83_CAERE|nr:hypothetical protein CRE_23533 [Caenorhabditis remanei]
MPSKGLLLCAILLGIALLVESVRMLMELPKENSDKFLKKLNDKRREMAKRLNISDAYELVGFKRTCLPISYQFQTWDPELVKQIAEARQPGGPIESHINRTYSGSCSLYNLSQTHCYKQLPEDGRESYSNYFSLLSPIHRRIGCVEWERNSSEIECFLGPGLSLNGYMDQGSFQGFYGVPGSNCTAGYVNHDGLCALIGSFTTEKPLTKPPAKPSSDAKDKDSVGVTDVTSGSSTTSILIGFLVFSVSFSFSY